MSEDQRKQELERVADTYRTVERVLVENEQLRARGDQFEQQTRLLEAEADNLRRQNKKMTAERDHYFRAYTALSAQLDQIASGLVTAIHLARAQAYGGRRPTPPLEEAREVARDIPRFLRGEQPAQERPAAPVDLGELAASIGGTRVQ
jgi:hypothetical protein